MNDVISIFRDKLIFTWLQVYDEISDTWKPKPEWEMAQGRYRYNLDVGT